METKFLTKTRFPLIPFIPLPIPNALDEPIDGIDRHGTDIHKHYHNSTEISAKSHFYLGGNGSILPDDFEYLKINYNISSTRPLDIHIVPSQSDFFNLSNNKHFNHSEFFL